MQSYQNLYVFAHLLFIKFYWLDFTNLIGSGHMGVNADSQRIIKEQGWIKHDKISTEI